MVDRRSARRWTFSLVAVAGGVALIFAPDLLPGAPQALADRSAIAARMASVVAALAWAAFFGLGALRSSDEFNRERAKFAWYWGSLIGLVVATPLIAFVALDGGRWLNVGAPGDPHASRAFASGAVLMLAAQVLGAAAVSFWWKATRR